MHQEALCRVRGRWIATARSLLVGQLLSSPLARDQLAPATAAKWRWPKGQAPESWASLALMGLLEAAQNVTKYPCESNDRGRSARSYRHDSARSRRSRERYPPPASFAELVQSASITALSSFPRLAIRDWPFEPLLCRFTRRARSLSIRRRVELLHQVGDRRKPDHLSPHVRDQKSL